ncbi:MAG: glycosyltransferase [Thermogemmata sp.]|uniref:Glycosyltransferase family 4 protein n=1 Tax=Thermogemmata fonticola TaxID=2755323 RepID=A0A7V8VDX3_9BACT|nr:glycosyltransferase [Thermogemmata fonticola]MBA2226060.1 glycosyltransferase family 4 protein [Thermogemmata fonticola]MCX8141107.1 glycosyltransferase family 4 protein [Gemmataceae bacterium]
MPSVRRLLTIGHSYVVAFNRRLPHELMQQGNGAWDVTVAAPRFVYGDLRPIHLENVPDESCRLQPLSAYFTRRPHLLLYHHRVRELLAQKWDIVHCWEEPFVLSSLQISLWQRSGKLVYYTFQNISKSYPPPFSWIECYSVNHCHGWIAAGYSVDHTLSMRAGYCDRPHCVIPLGVDTLVFHPEREAGVSVRRQLGWAEGGPPVVGYLGRFVAEKGILFLLRVLERLRVAWRALFVGGGPLEGCLRRWAERQGAERAQVVTGVAHQAVPRYLNAMDVLAAPSQTTPRWKEQFGRMLIEAMACGVPVAGSDSGEIPYVVGDAGLVLPEADAAAWVAGLAGLLESPARRRELAAAGRERTCQRYAWPVAARQHLRFFQQLLDLPCHD